jgi:hypothetical protein
MQHEMLADVAVRYSYVALFYNKNRLYQIEGKAYAVRFQQSLDFTQPERALRARRRRLFAQTVAAFDRVTGAAGWSRRFASLRNPVHRYRPHSRRELEVRSARCREVPPNRYRLGAA